MSKERIAGAVRGGLAGSELRVSTGGESDGSDESDEKWGPRMADGKWQDGKLEISDFRMGLMGGVGRMGRIGRVGRIGGAREGRRRGMRPFLITRLAAAGSRKSWTMEM